jgi:hypothetical protein
MIYLFTTEYYDFYYQNFIIFYTNIIPETSYIKTYTCTPTHHVDIKNRILEKITFNGGYNYTIIKNEEKLYNRDISFEDNVFLNIDLIILNKII